MRSFIRIPIAIKLAVVSIIILLVALVPTALQTSKIFKDVSGKREEDSNRAQADAKANEVAAILDNLVQKTTFFGGMLLKEKLSSGGKKEKLLRQNFYNDKDFVSLEIYSRRGGKLTLIEKLENVTYLKGYKLSLDYLRRINKKKPFAIRKIFSGESLIRNRSLVNGAPLLTIGLPLAKDKLGRVAHIIVANVQLNSIQKAFGDSGERTIFLVNNLGEVFAHPEDKLAMGGVNLKKLDIVKKAVGSKLAMGQMRYYNPAKKEYFIAAYAKTKFDLAVISEAPESLILEPATFVERQVYFITGLVLSGALFIIFLFSLSITRPIEKLVLITREIARGNFGIPVAQIIRSNDEVGTLAMSFDAMLGGLRERDKVKNLFNKFHGSSVTEDLLKRDTVSTQGTRKKVVVFFSDIRGFTALSENASPEDVVAMVNEYFQEMVNVILRNHGIVDKFIGDAIMAIWGSPQTTGNDSYYAIKACVEMRQALAALNERRIARGEGALMIGMGLHTGEAISGTIGSQERMEFTVIGDTVNMASRIEASTKAFGTDLLVSETLVEEVGSRFIINQAGAAKVKGKTEPLKLFKVDGFVHENGSQEIVRTPYSEYEASGADKVDVV